MIYLLYFQTKKRAIMLLENVGITYRLKLEERNFYICLNRYAADSTFYVACQNVEPTLYRRP